MKKSAVLTGQSWTRKRDNEKSLGLGDGLGITSCHLLSCVFLAVSLNLSEALTTSVQVEILLLISELVSISNGYYHPVECPAPNSDNHKPFFPSSWKLHKIQIWFQPPKQYLLQVAPWPWKRVNVLAYLHSLTRVL